MTYSEFLKFLKDKTGYVRDLGEGRDIICRCPFCGDSVKNKHKGHLYVSKTLGVFHCFRCNTAGQVAYLLSVLECNDSIDGLVVKRIKQPTKYVPSEVRQIQLPPPGENDQHKVEYLQQRGVDVDEYTKYRIVWNLDTFLRKNALTVDLPYDNYNMLVNDYVGFVTLLGYKLILRDVTNKHRWRYFNVLLGDNTDYYAIDNFTYTTIPHVVVCEGVFDVILATKKLQYNAVYVASGTKSGVSALQWAMLAFGLFKPKVTVVVDTDAVNTQYKYKRLQRFIESIEFILPVGGKDIAEVEQYAILRG